MKLLPLTLMTGAVLVSAVALAADATFTAADQDSDGVLTMAEVMIAMPEATPDGFNSADVDENGALTEAEFLAAIDSGLLPKG